MNQTPFLNTVARTLAERSLCPNGTRVLIAVSGGRDSVALLLALVRLLRGKVDLRVGHVHHGLREADADADQAFVQELAAAHDLPFVAARVTIPRRPGATSYEAPARAARYAAYSRWAKELALDAIATGHTADDQVETVLLRMFRGAGIAGLCGIPYERPLPDAPACRMIRPLLGTTRAQTTAFVAACGARFRDDASNLDVRIPRNRLRREILPLLRAGFNAHLDAAILGLAHDARELQDRARADIAPLAPAGRDSFALPLATLAALTPVALHELLVAAAAQHADRLTRTHVRAVRALLERTSRRASLPGGLVITRSADTVFFAREKSACAPEECTLGEGDRSTFGGWTLTCLPETDADASRNGSAGIDAARPARAERIDADAVTLPLLVRSRAPGDRFRQLGAPGHTKLKEFLRAQGVPEPLRAAWPIVCAGREIIWVPALRIGHAVRRTASTRRCLALQVTDVAPEVRSFLAARHAGD